MTMKAYVLDSSIFRVFPEVIVPDAYDSNIEMRPSLITIDHDHILKIKKVLIKKSVVFIDKLKIAQEVRDQTVEDGQRVAEAVLWAEAKLGELLKGIDKSDSRLRGSTKGTTVKPTLPEGITKKQSHEAQQLADNPEEIREVIQEARDNEDIPIRSSEAIGSPQISLGVNTSGIVSAEAIGTPQVTFAIVETGIPTAEAIGNKVARRLHAGLGVCLSCAQATVEILKKGEVSR